MNKGTGMALLVVGTALVILPICENDMLVGTVTDRDITVRAVAEGRIPYTTKVRDVMTGKTIYALTIRI